MGSVTGLTAARMLAIEAACIVDGDVVGDDLILTKHDGSTIDAGVVKNWDAPPIGGVLAWTRKNLPSGGDYVLADGATLTQDAYPEGHAVAVAEVALGNNLWTVSGSNFTVPDLRDRFILGKGATYNVLNARSGAATHTLTAAEIPAHTHTFQERVGWGAGSSVLPAWDGNANDAAYGGAAFATDNGTGGGGAHNNMPPYVVLGYIVKIKTTP